MDWETRLISTYLTVSDSEAKGLFFVALRMSNNQGNPPFTDGEVLTVFLNGIMMGKNTLKAIFDFTSNFLRSWFPNLGSYESFVRRLNNLSDVFPELIRLVQEKHTESFSKTRYLIDSFPVILAAGPRSRSAKVAPELADKGFSSSKDTYYYGVKVHVLASDVDGSIPKPWYIGMTEASTHDRVAFDQIASELYNTDVFGDKAYCNKEENQALLLAQDVQVSTPVKLKKGQTRLDSADLYYSQAVSSIRQPIESLFSWITEKTSIQKGSKIRSSKGLMVHIFGRLAAAILLMLYP